MKRLFMIFAALLLPLVVATNAADADPNETDNMANGRAWVAWSETFKLGYVSGYSDHWTGTALALEKVKDWENEKEAWPRLTNGEVVTALDEFFKTPENRNLAIRYALFIIAQKVQGAPSERLQKMTEHLRGISVAKSEVAKQ
jgi:hypothetical protein